MKALKKPTAVEMAADALREELRAGNWDERVPGTRVLAARLGVSAPTVAAALNHLADEGLLKAAGPRRAYRVLGKPGAARRRRKGTQPRELLILVPGEFGQLVEGTRRLLEMLMRRVVERGWLVRHQVVDFLHVKRPQAAWDRRILVEEGTKVVAVYGGVALAEWARRRGLHILFVGGGSVEFPVAKIAVSSARMAEEVMGRLTALGHRRIVMPLCDRTEEFKDKLRNVTRQAVETAGVAYVPGYHNPESVYATPEVILRILEKVFAQRAPTALVLIDWKEAVRTACFLAERGLRVPRDVSLAVLSDSVTAEWFHPKLCRFRFPERRMVLEVVKWLEEKPGSERGASLSGIYLEGDSIGPPPDKAGSP
jgi:DNA-binding Lrp family transcriptional regulator